MNNNKNKELIKNKFNIKKQFEYPEKTKTITNYKDEEKHVHDFTKYDVDSIQNLYIEEHISKNSDKKYKEHAHVHDHDHDHDQVYYGDQLASKSNSNKLTKIYLKNKTIHICVYQLIKDAIKPFVMFLLYKDDDNIMYLPTIAVSDTIVEDTLKKMNHVFQEWNPKLTYKGFIDNGDGNIVVVLEFKQNEYGFDTNKYDSKWWWALSTEIVNNKKLLNFNIDYSVTHFFLNNIELLFINNKAGHQYECPCVGYYGDDHKYIDLTFSLGRNRNDDMNAEFGPFYYFYNYEQAIHEAEAKTEAIQEAKGGLVRFALFTGKIKVEITDDIEDYDSITRSKPYLLVVKKKEQQIPLAYYYVNTSKSVIE
jgi:hypothetical protein